MMNPINAPPHDLTTGCGSAPYLKTRYATPTTSTPRPGNGTMAASTAQPVNTASEYGSDVEIRSVAALSDYGSDIGLDDIDEDAILADVLDVIKDTRPVEKGCVLPSIEFEEGEHEDEEQDVDGFVQIHRPTRLRVAKEKRDNIKPVDTQRAIQSSPLREDEVLEVEYDERSRRTWSGTLSILFRSITGMHRLTTNSV
jgi:exonuclease V